MFLLHKPARECAHCSDPRMLVPRDPRMPSGSNQILVAARPAGVRIRTLRTENGRFLRFEPFDYGQRSGVGGGSVLVSHSAGASACDRKSEDPMGDNIPLRLRPNALWVVDANHSMSDALVWVDELMPKTRSTKSLRSRRAGVLTTVRPSGRDADRTELFILTMNRPDVIAFVAGEHIESSRRFTGPLKVARFGTTFRASRRRHTDRIG